MAIIVVEQTFVDADPRNYRSKYSEGSWYCSQSIVGFGKKGSYCDFIESQSP